MGRGGVVHHGPRGAAADLRGPARGVDLDVGQVGQVDHDRVIGGAETWHAVPAPADRHGTPGSHRVRDGGLHVGGVRTANDGVRPGVDHEVVHMPGILVLGILGTNDAPGDERVQFDGGHERLPLFRVPVVI